MIVSTVDTATNTRLFNGLAVGVQGFLTPWPLGA
jgi:hypothetical protein